MGGRVPRISVVPSLSRRATVARGHRGRALGGAEFAVRAWFASDLTCAAKYTVRPRGAQRGATVERVLRCFPTFARSAFGGPGTACVLPGSAIDTVQRKIVGRIFVAVFSTGAIKTLFDVCCSKVFIVFPRWTDDARLCEG